MQFSKNGAIAVSLTSRRTHMVWTEENTLHVPSVCLANVMERKEARRLVVRMSCLAQRNRRLAPKVGVLVYTYQTSNIQSWEMHANEQDAPFHMGKTAVTSINLAFVNVLFLNKSG